jgi:hypothetical protein
MAAKTKPNNGLFFIPSSSLARSPDPPTVSCTPATAPAQPLVEIPDRSSRSRGRDDAAHLSDRPDQPSDFRQPAFRSVFLIGSASLDKKQAADKESHKKTRDR